MKNKLIITLLALTITTAMLAGCGKKETASVDVDTESTETVAEVNTETETVVETETEESTEGAELVLNTETTEKAEVVATGDKNTGTNKKSDTKKTESTKTDSKDAGTKVDSTKNDSATQAPAETTTNTPAETPAETPAPAPEPAPAQNLCPYTLNQWLDLGDGWWGFYTSSSTPRETISALNDKFTNVIVTPDATWTYDDWGNENLGDYDDYKSVQLAKVHMVPITN